MSFFARHPKFWASVWAIFALGGAVMLFETLSGSRATVDAFRGAVALLCGLMMIGLIRKNARS